MEIALERWYEGEEGNFKDKSRKGFRARANVTMMPRARARDQGHAMAQAASYQTAFPSHISFSINTFAASLLWREHVSSL